MNNDHDVTLGSVDSGHAEGDGLDSTEAGAVRAGSRGTDKASARVGRSDPSPEHRTLRYGLTAGVLMLASVASLAVWTGSRVQEARSVQHRDDAFVAAAKSGAEHLTSISYTQADADVQRILDSSTGAFHDDFAQRAKPFVDLVKKAQSTTVGVVSQAALEATGDQSGRVLVTVSVKTSNAGVPDGEDRSWRMRLTLDSTDAGPKMSSVEFVQ